MDYGLGASFAPRTQLELAILVARKVDFVDELLMGQTGRHKEIGDQ